MCSYGAIIDGKTTVCINFVERQPGALRNARFIQWNAAYKYFIINKILMLMLSDYLLRQVLYSIDKGGQEKWFGIVCISLQAYKSRMYRLIKARGNRS